MSDTLIYWLLIALMVVGVIGAFVPALPGAVLILVGVVIWGFIKGVAAVQLPLITILVVLILNFGVDFLATYLGAKHFGSSNWAQIGAVVGMLLGVFGLLPALPFGGPIVGLLFGPILGAFVGEFLYQRKLEVYPRLKQSLMSSLGIIVGSILGKFLQGLFALAALVVFVLTTFPPAALPGS